MSFGSCSAWGNGKQMTHLGERCAWGGLGAGGSCKSTIKWALSKKISEESTDTSCALLTGCFLDTICRIALQKLHISEYVCKSCLKELAINTGKPLKNTAASNISKHSALIFLPYFKNKYFLEHITMTTSGNVTKCCIT